MATSQPLTATMGSPTHGMSIYRNASANPIYTSPPCSLPPRLRKHYYAEGIGFPFSGATAENCFITLVPDDTRSPRVMVIVKNQFHSHSQPHYCKMNPALVVLFKSPASFTSQMYPQSYIFILATRCFLIAETEILKPKYRNVAPTMLNTAPSDIDFFLALIRHEQATKAIDASRIHLSGISNGAP
jgi:hypothetical protein